MVISRLGNFINRTAALKRKSYEGLLVLYIEAEKNHLKQTAFHSLLLWCKVTKKGECSALLWSFNFVSKLIRAANCVRFCLNPFCREVHEGCLPHDKKDSDKTVHNLQLTSAWIRS